CDLRKQTMALRYRDAPKSWWCLQTP
ncbi:hypothetical protein D030_3178B, partial [Vibrio parahaemolyticus AQ3810]